MTKRANGEGSIYFVVGKGTARYRKARTDPWQTGTWVGSLTMADGRRCVRKAQSRDAVAGKLLMVQEAVRAGLPVGDGDRVGAFCTWWLATLEAKAASDEKSVNTVDNAKWAITHWIIPKLGPKRLRELEPEHVEGMLVEMVAAGLGRESVKRIRSYLGQALAVAERRGKVARNVARIAEMPATPPPVEKRPLNIGEVRKVLVAAVGDRLEALFVMAMMLGMRPGELTGLLWEWIDLTAGTIHVAGSLKRERGKLRLGGLKTDGSDRPLKLPAPVLVVLKAHRLRQLEERLSSSSWATDCDDPVCASKDHGGCRLVFTNEIGGPIDPSNLRRATKNLCVKAGVEPVSPNEMGRHTAANLLYEAGVPLEQIADLLGHESTRMLEKYYRKRGRQSVSVAVAPMEALFGNP